MGGWVQTAAEAEQERTLGTDSCSHHCFCFLSQDLPQLCRKPGQQDQPVGQCPPSEVLGGGEE